MQGCMRYLNQSSENDWSFILWFDARPFILLFVNSCCQISFSINRKKTTNMLRYYSFSLSIYILGLYILAETTISQLELRTICCNQHAVHVLNLSTVATWYVSDSFDSIKERFAYSYIVSPRYERARIRYLACEDVCMPKPWNYPLRWWDLNWHVDLLSRKGSFRVTVILAIFVGANLDCYVLRLPD